MNLKKKINRTVCTFLAALCLLLASVPPRFSYAVSMWPEEPEITAPSAILIEASTGSILYEKSSREKHFPASTTKLMTVLLAIEQCRLSDTIEMSHDAVYSMGWDASRVGMWEGEQLSLEDSLYAILLASANEVCYAVAEHIGKGDISSCIDMMNERSRELGCVNSHYMNPHGLHDASHYTCAYDLAVVMRKCITYPTFNRISNNYYYTLPETNLNLSRDIAQTHKILRRTYSYDGVFAGKTGHTDEAGNCLVTACERNGLTLICVVMGEPKDSDCYNDTIALFDYGYDNFELTTPSGDENSRNAFPVLFSDNDAFVHKVTSALSISETTLVLPIGARFSDVTNKCTLTPLIEMEPGKNVIGKAIYYYADREVGTADVIFTSDSFQLVDPAAAYLREFENTEDFNEEIYKVLTGELQPEEPEIVDLRPRIIGYMVGIIVFVAALAVLIKIYAGGRR